MTSKQVCLSRNEQSLLDFFRKLSVEQQLEFLEEVEEMCNHSARMQELAKRNLERGSYGQSSGLV